jgi:hypothetical protein
LTINQITMFQFAAGPAVVGVTAEGGVRVTLGGSDSEQGSDPLATPVVDGVTPTITLNVQVNEETLKNAKDFLVVVWKHIQRAFMWRRIHSKYAHYQTKTLNDNQEEQQVTLDHQQEFNLWRRSVLFISCPLVGIRVILSLVRIFKSSFREYFNGFGMAVLAGYIIGMILDIVSISASLWFWNSYEKSSRYLAIGWIGSLVLSLWFIASPVSFLLKGTILDQSEDISAIAYRWAIGMAFTMILFPLLITIPMSMTRSALFIKGILPETSIAGFFIVLVSPLASILVLITGVMLSQLIGNTLSFIGIMLQMLAPIIMVIRSRLFFAPRDEKIDVEITWAHWTTEAMSIVGLLCFVIWAADEKLLNDGVEVARVLFEMFGRSLITTLFFADRLFDMSVCQLFSIRKAMGRIDWSSVKMLMEHYDSKYSDFKLTEKEMAHFMDHTERNED